MTLRPIGEALGNHKHATGVRGQCARTLARFAPAGRPKLKSRNHSRGE